MGTAADAQLATGAQTAVAALAQRAVKHHTADALLHDAITTVGEVLDVDLCGFLEARAEPGTFVMRASMGFRDGLVGSTVPAGRDSAVAYMMRAKEPVVYEDLRHETRFSPPRLLLEHGVRSGLGVGVPAPTGSYGVLGIHATALRTFSPEDVLFAVAVAAVIGSGLRSFHAEAMLARQDHEFIGLADAAHDIIFRISADDEPRFTYVNPAIERVLGYAPTDVVDSPAVRVIHPEDRAVLFEPPLADEASSRSIRMLRQDGSIAYCEVHTIVTRDEAGRVVQIEGIAHDMTEQRMETDLLRRAFERERAIAEQLRTVDRMKDAFLQAVSHELRTPLASIVGMAATLNDRFDDLDSDMHRTLADRLDANARRLQQLLGDLLDLDRLLRRTIEPTRSPTDVRALIDTALANVDTGGRVVHVSGEPVIVPVDGPKVERVVENLLANAARHTPEDARIWVTVESAGDGALLTVADDGPGVAPELRSTIFEPFKRGAGGKEHAPGTGIGLSLVARFAELHGGRAWVEERPGGGAQFRVLLPAGTEQPWSA